MNSFPPELHVSNKEAFASLLFNDHLQRLRREVMFHMLHRKENDFFDLDVFNRKYVKDVTILLELVDVIEKELHELGWSTYLGFGDTGLYVYSSEEKPDGVY